MANCANADVRKTLDDRGPYYNPRVPDRDEKQQETLIIMYKLTSGGSSSRIEAAAARWLRVSSEDVGVSAARGAKHPAGAPRVVAETNVELCGSHVYSNF